MNSADINIDEAIFIDVRTVEEFAEDNLEGSNELPRSKLTRYQLEIL